MMVNVLKSIFVSTYAKASENKYTLCMENYINRQGEYLHGRIHRCNCHYELMHVKYMSVLNYFNSLWTTIKILLHVYPLLGKVLVKKFPQRQIPGK
jgi:hypothetical protein